MRKSKLQDKDKLIKTIENSLSLSQVLKKYGLKPRGGNYKTLHYYISLYDIKTNHFLGQGWNLGNSPSIKKPLSYYLVANRHCSTYALKKKLFIENIKEEKCEICNLENQWNGDFISLHLDHINGINNDNRIENLRILCPNCHSQTKTYAGKKLRKHTKVKIKKIISIKTKTCLECNKDIDRKAVRCKSCELIKRHNENRKFILPKKNELEKLLRKTNFTQVGKKYKVSDNSVRKWCKKYSLPTNSSYYK